MCKKIILLLIFYALGVIIVLDKGGDYMSDLGNKDILAKNLKRYMDLKGVDRSTLSEILDVPYSTLSDWINANKYPRIDKIEMLANYFNIEKSDLIERHIDLTTIPGIRVMKNLINVPILGHIQCGAPVLSECNYEGYFKLDPDLCKADFSLVADGDSMIDANIHEGDIVFFQETPDVESGTIAAVLLDEQTTLKKVIKMDDSLILQPANDKYKPILIKEGDYSNVMILGKMVGVFSKRDK